MSSPMALAWHWECAEPSTISNMTDFKFQSVLVIRRMGLSSEPGTGGTAPPLLVALGQQPAL